MRNISIRYAQVPRLDAGSAESVAYLEEHGYVVIRSALTTDQAGTAIELLWDYLEGLGTGIDRNDCDTWDDDRWPTAVHGGILPSHGIGHSAAQWFIRDVAAVQDSFAAIWDTNDLLTSFDGVTIWRPWRHNSAWRTNDGPSWLHIDQHPIGRPGKHCVQGLVNLLPTSPSTGGNVVVPGSHRRFASIPTDYVARLARIHSSIDHFRFPNDDPLLANTQPIQAHMEAGDMLLWDSRTIHCSGPGSETPPDDKQLLRAASLICMMPRSKSNPEVIERRKRAVADRTSTTNWSDVFVNADEFPQITAVEDRHKYQWPPVPELNRRQKELAGWSPFELDE
ncbi:MAG: phytanoyl-CoA dioxygenase family protein [Pseudomonadota bacterium]